MQMRTVRRFLRGQDWPQPFHRLTSAYPQAQTVVRIYYVITLYLLADRITNNLPDWLAQQAGELPLLWPLRWAVWTGMSPAVYLIVVLAIGGVVGSILWPEKRPFRLVAFIGLFFIIALLNSFGKINHNFHGWLAVSFCFLLLPDGEEKRPLRGHRLTYLTAFWFAQALILWFYSMSGAWKVNVGISQLLAGEVNAFHPYAMAHQVANRLLQEDTSSVLGPFLLDFPLLGWPLYLSAVYLELFSFVVAFRPSLHRFWGISLALFHFGTYFTMSITFNQNILLVGFLLVASPFHPPDWHWRSAVRDLPFIGYLLGKVLPNKLFGGRL